MMEAFRTDEKRQKRVERVSEEHLVRLVAIALREVLGREPGPINAGTRLFEDLTIDSTGVIQLLMALEDVVPGFQLDPDTLVPDDLVTVGSLVAYILRSVHANGSRVTADELKPLD